MPGNTLPSYLRRFLLMFFMCYAASTCIGQAQTGEEEARTDTALKEIVLVFKSHYDIGYSDYAEGVLQKYAAVSIPDALDLIDKSKILPKDRQFVWTIPGWPMKEDLDRVNPAIKTRTEAALKNGNFVIHALPFNIETESCDPEMLVRGMNIASTLSRKYHFPLPRDAKQTDVPSHSWILPGLLKHAGVDFLHIGCNYTSGAPELPLLFWWEGPDGSRLMTMYYAPAYGTQLMPPSDWKHKTWLALMVKNDNEPPPTLKEVQDLIAEAHRRAPNATIKIGRMSDFYDDIMKEHPQLPVVRGDMPDTWIHGYMSMPREVKASGSVSKDLLALESLNTLYKLWTPNGYDISRTLSDAYTNDLLFDEHTFGLSMSYFQNGVWAYGDTFRLNRAGGMYDDIERSWHEKADRVFDAEKVIVPSLKRQLREMASEVNVVGKRIFVYNDLPWERSGIVTVKESSADNPGTMVKDLRTGEIFALSNKDNLLRFVARNIPAMGYRTYIILNGGASAGIVSPTVQASPQPDASGEDPKTDEAANSIENRYYKIQFDPAKGCISSIVEKKTGKEKVDTHSEYGFGQYLYERFCKSDMDTYNLSYTKPYGSHASDAEFCRPSLPEGPHVTVRGGTAKMVFSKDATGISATMVFTPSKDLPHNYSITVTLPEDAPGIELVWGINGKPAEPWPEAGWISLPFNVNNPSFKLGRLGAVADPSKDFIKGSNFDYCFLNTGMAVIDGAGNGFGLSSPDAPAISMDRPGLWKYSRYFIPQRPNVFINLYNNLWGTNFTEWVEGTWSVKMKLWNVDQFNNEQSIITPSEAFSAPLKAVLVDGNGGKLPVTASGIQLSMRGVLVTAFGKNPDGEGTILRLWEQAGNSGKCIVTLPEHSSFTAARFCDLRGQFVGQPFRIIDGKIETDMKAYQPVSVILK